VKGGAEAPGGPPALAILGTRGVPAAHGGFETLAERLALELVARGWRVEVYCQVREPAPPTLWRGVVLIPVAVRGDGAVSTILFDLKCTLRAAFRPALPLVLGYNTAAFSLLYRLMGRRSVMNMDGIEWRRDRWSKPAKAWFWLNERFGSLFSTHLVADHPEIAKHLARRTSPARITTIAYGADPVLEAPTAPLEPFGVRPRSYGLLIARVVPENLVLQIVRAWSEIRPGLPLVVLGKLDTSDAYHRCVRAAGGPDVIFAGAIYEAETVAALRLHARFHIHGHTVGGTNPSLVEALGAGSPILAHDNPFNRWVAGEEAVYFGDETELRRGILALVRAAPRRLDAMSSAARRRHAEAFTWRGIFDAYERVLRQQMARVRSSHREELAGVGHGRDPA
jgi:glycosyltransferase involved in cell wall biosynthesis